LYSKLGKPTRADTHAASNSNRIAEIVATEDLSEVLIEFARTMVTDFPIQGILDHLVKRIVDIMPITAAGVTLISPGIEPRYIAASDESALRFEKLQTELGEGPCVAAYHTGEAIAAPDLRSELRFPKFSRQGLDAGLAAVFTFPLRHGELRLGALDLYSDMRGPLSTESMSTAQTLADVAAAYLLNAKGRADLQDVSDQSRKAALHDALTGLPNRILLLERLEHAFLRGRRSNKTSAVFFVDLNGFKAVNDTHGHQVGDDLLVAVGQRLTAVLRPGDTLARLSGDEFAILCEELDDPSQASAIAARCDEALVLPFVLSETEVTITASIGVAFTGRSADAPEQVIQDADRAMYRSKRRRTKARRPVDLREPHLTKDQDSLKRDLSGAAERGELQVAYQPIVAAGDARLTAAEALLRWNHPDRGSVPPTVLIPLAEQSGMIIGIGRWVLEQACSARRHWQMHRTDDLAVSVNVSAHQLMTAGFVDIVEAVLDSASTDARLLILETTESVFVREGERALGVLNDLKDVGVQLALDDFGTGYSSLGYLMRFPVDIIKLDRTFIADLGRDPASDTIVSSVIHLAHDLGMTIVAEGMETAGQHEELTRLGCDSCQGFYFARPMSASSLDRLIEHSPDGSTRLPARALSASG
jgi:diguanylate cyclase (GGDEF)-like protein